MEIPKTSRERIEKALEETGFDKHMINPVLHETTAGTFELHYQTIDVNGEVSSEKKLVTDKEPIAENKSFMTREGRVYRLRLAGVQVVKEL